MEFDLEEFFEYLSWCSGSPVEDIRKMWDRGDTLGTLAMGFAQKDGKPYIPGVIGTDPNEIT